MSLDQPTCPTCSGALVLTTSGELDTWNCSAGHGLGMTLSEGYGRVQEDELHELWVASGAAGAPQSPHQCPMCEGYMARAVAPIDDDEAWEGAPGDGANRGTLEIDVCRLCQLIWFDAGEFERLPADIPDPALTPEQVAHLEEVREATERAVDERFADEDRRDLAERLYKRFFGRRIARR
jgi:Zn-finger nucleic acid-binding protein